MCGILPHSLALLPSSWLVTYINIPCRINSGMYAFYFRVKFPVIAHKRADKHKFYAASMFLLYVLWTNHLNKSAYPSMTCCYTSLQCSILQLTWLPPHKFASLTKSKCTRLHDSQWCNPDFMKIDQQVQKLERGRLTHAVC
jgi:hypothetical protein